MTNERKMVYLNIALGAIAVLTAVLFFKARAIPSSPGPAEGTGGQKTVSFGYDAASAAQSGPTTEPVGGQAGDLASAYRTSSRSDIGPNMPELWARLQPEVKAEAIKELDNKARDAKEALTQDPADKRAKHILFITETLKQLAADDFNYKAPAVPVSSEETRETR